MENLTEDPEEFIYKVLIRSLRVLSIVIGVRLEPEVARPPSRLQVARRGQLISISHTTNYLIWKIRTERLMINRTAGSISLRRYPGTALFFLITKHLVWEKTFLVILKDGSTSFVHLCPYGDTPPDKSDHIYFWILDSSFGIPLLIRGILEKTEITGILSKDKSEIFLPEFYDVCIIEREDLLRDVIRVLLTKDLIITPERSTYVPRAALETFQIAKLSSEIREVITPLVSSELRIPLKPYNIKINCEILGSFYMAPPSDLKHSIRVYGNGLIDTYFLGYSSAVSNVRMHGLLPLIKGSPEPISMTIDPSSEAKSIPIRNGMVLMRTLNLGRKAVGFFGIYKGWIFSAVVFEPDEGGSVEGSITIFYDRKVYPILLRILSMGLFIGWL